MSIVLFCTVPASLHSLASGMTVFDGSNFSEWYERVQFSLGVLDLDLTLITDKPPEATIEYMYLLKLRFKNSHSKFKRV